jgi:hypothetical protein
MKAVKKKQCYNHTYEGVIRRKDWSDGSFRHPGLDQVLQKQIFKGNIGSNHRVPDSLGAAERFK